MRSLRIITILSLVLMSTSVLAQDGKTKREQKEAQKVAFFTEKIGLTADEAAVFWPVYKAYGEEKKAIRKQHKKGKPNGHKIGEMSDEEVEKLLDAVMDFKQKDLDLKKKYHLKYKTILPIKKVAKLYHAEEQFKKNQGARGKF